MSPDRPAADAPRRRRRRAAAIFAGGLIAGLALVGLSALAVIEGGLFNAGAARPHNALIGWATHETFRHWVERQAGPAPPDHFTPDRVAAGFRLYDKDCVACHGGPGIARAGWTRGLTPTPPYLLDASRLWSPGQLHLIIDQGAKMTAMPAWGVTRSREEIWDLVAFLESLPHTTAADYARMRAASGSPKALGAEP